ncbi:MAG: hypothetical protein QM831_22065 [Kofleriaceae bacterium]
MQSVFLQGAAKLLVILHAAAAIVLIGSITHHFLITLGYLRGSFKIRLGRIYAATILATYSITFAFGLLAYPTFRYFVRGVYLDRYERWASNLFDVKENFAALGLPLAVGIFVLSRTIQPKDDYSLVRGYAALTVLLTAIVWFDVFSGLVITMTKGV